MKDLFLMLLADARLPTAGHTQSATLEPAVAYGLAADEVAAYLDLRLRTVTRVEAATGVVGLHHLRQSMPIEPVELAWAARTPSAAMRATSHAMGRAFLRIALRLWPGHPSLRVVGSDASRAVVLAAAANACGLPPAALAKLIGYDDVQTVASAALKLLPLDPADVAVWVRDALPNIERMALDVAALTDPADIPSAGAPQIEAWAESHAAATRRLFSA